MFNLRGTTRFLNRGRADGNASAVESTTVLGDWYANLLHLGRRQVVLCTSQRSLLSVVFPAQHVRESFGDNLRSGVGELLRALDVSEHAVLEELAEMDEYVVTGTESRSVLGSMSDFKIQVEYRVKVIGEPAWTQLSLELSDVPCSPLGYKHPAEMARDLFRAKV